MVSPATGDAAGVPSAVLDAIATALGDRATRQAPLGARTTYRVGGCAEVLVEAQGEDDLVAVHDALTSAGVAVPLFVLGEGSNLLVADAGFPGIVVRLGVGVRLGRDSSARWCAPVGRRSSPSSPGAPPRRGCTVWNGGSGYRDRWAVPSG